MRTVERALGVFDCFTQARPTLRLQEIVRRTGLAKSTTFRLVASLVDSGYLLRLENQQYCLSFKFTRLAGLVQGTLSIRDVARPVMLQLSRMTGETVTLNEVEGRQRICLDVVHVMSPLMSVTKAGTRSSLADGATARVLMAHLPEPGRAAAITYAARLARFRREDLVKDLELARKRGWAVTHGERVLGLTAVSAPIGDSEGGWPWCITIAGPTIRLQSRERELVRHACRAATRISRQMGASDA